MKFQWFAAAAVVSVLACADAATAAVISDGTGAFSVGVAENGQLYDGAVGFSRNADGFDPISPGTPHDSWGVSIMGGDAAYADQFGLFGGSYNLGDSPSLVAGANSATASAITGLGLTVVQNYSFVGGGNILKIDTLVTNTTDSALSALFQRDVDFDIPSTAFDETIIGGFGSASGIVDSSYYGFEFADPNQPYLASGLGGCDIQGDLGAGIKIDLGSIASGATRRFSYFYGLNLTGDSLDDLVAQGHAVGASYIVAATSSENPGGSGANSAFIGVSGGVPEPAAWAMMILGFFGLGSAIRRRRAVAA
jgi:hypothetical protein